MSGIVWLEHLDVMAYTFTMAYDMGVQEVRLRALTTGDGDRGMALDQWVWVWGKPRTLLYMQRGLAEEPREPLEVWHAFGRLYLPK